MPRLLAKASIGTWSEDDAAGESSTADQHGRGSLGPRLRLHPGRERQLPGGQGSRRRDVPRVAGAAGAYAGQPGVHAPRGPVSRAGGGHPAVSRHRHRPAHLAQCARGRPGGTPRRQHRLRRQRPDRARARAGASDQLPRGPHRLCRRRYARPRRDPRLAPVPGAPRSARTGRAADHRHPALHPRHRRRPRPRPASAGPAARGQLPGHDHRHRRLRSAGGGPRRRRVRASRHADATAYTGRGRGVLRRSGPGRAGVTQVHHWRPDADQDDIDDRDIAMYGGVARKNA